MYYNFLNNKAHAFKTLLIGTILPHGVIVNLMNSIYKTYLKTKIDEIVNTNYTQKEILELLQFTR